METQYTKKEEELKPLLTDELLRVITQAAQTYGHTGDWPAVKDFIRYCYDMADKHAPDSLDPFEE